MSDSADILSLVQVVGVLKEIKDSIETNLLSINALKSYLGVSGTNTGDSAVNSLYSGLVSNATHTGAVTGASMLSIADGAVTTNKIADSAVTNAKISNGAVSVLSGTNTGDGAVNSLYSGLVSNATHTGAVTGASVLSIADGAVTTNKIADSAVTGAKISVKCVTPAHILPMSTGSVIIGSGSTSPPVSTDSPSFGGQISASQVCSEDYQFQRNISGIGYKSGGIYVPVLGGYTVWSGVSRSSVTNSYVTLSSTYVPSNATAAVVRCSWSAAAASNSNYLILLDKSSGAGAVVARALVANIYTDASGVCGLTAGKLYYSVGGVSGHAYLVVLGYFL